MPYIVPSVSIIQQLSAGSVPEDAQFSACIIGPNKVFLDYADSEDKVSAYIGDYDSVQTEVFEYPGREAGQVVDQETARLYFDFLRAELYSNTDGVSLAHEPNTIQAATNGLYFADYTNDSGQAYPKSSALHNRGAKVGDYLEVTDGVESYTGKIIDLDPKVTPSSVGSFSANALNHNSVDFVGVYTEPTLAATHGGSSPNVGFRGYYQEVSENTVYTITCTVTGALGTAEFSVTDTGSDISGTQTIATVSGQSEYAIGSRGIVMVLEGVGSYDSSTPDQYVVTATSAANEAGVIQSAGSYTGSSDLLYTITVIDKGGSGVARVKVTTPSGVDDSGPHTVVAGQAFEIGSLGAQVVFTFPNSGVLIPGDSWTLQCYGDGLGPVSEKTVASFEDDTMTLTGEYNGTVDAILEVLTTTGGAFGTAEFSWAYYEAVTDDTPLIPRRSMLASGTIVTTGTDTADTIHLLDSGVGIKLIPDGGTFTATHESQARLYSDGFGQPSVGTLHDQLSDSVETRNLIVEVDEDSFILPGTTVNAAASVGSMTVSGKHRGTESTAINFAVDTAGTLGTCILDVTGGVLPAGTKLITEAGVTRYFIPDPNNAGVGTGVILNFSSNFSSGASFDVDVDFDLSNTPMSSHSIVQGYRHAQKIRYELTCTATSPYTFDITSTNGVDDVSGVEMDGSNNVVVGTRGLIIQASLSSAFIVGSKLIVDTEKASNYSGADDDTYYARITRGGPFGVAEVEFYSASGDSSGPYLLTEASEAANVGKSNLLEVGTKGILARVVDSRKATFSPDVPSNFYEGDVFSVSATADLVEGINTFVLGRNLPAGLQGQTGLTYKVLMSMQDVVIPEEAPSGADNYLLDTTTISISPSITVQDSEVFDLVSGSPVPVNMPVRSGAKMYVVYEALDTSSSRTLASISNSTEIEGAVGAQDPRNPLGYALGKAAANSTSPIYYIRVASDDLEGYQDALAVLDESDVCYLLVPLSQDSEITSLFSTNVDNQSDNFNNFRATFLSQELVTHQDILVQRTNSLGDLVDYTATISDDPSSADLDPAIYTKVYDPDASFLEDGVVAGDLFLTDYTTLDSGEVVAGSSYEIDSVVSEEILLLKSGPTSPVVSAVKYQVSRPLSKDEQAAGYAATAASFGSRRTVLLWPDRLESEGSEVSGVYACAALAGLVSSIPPHQGLTNVSFAGFSGAKRSFEYFSTSQLNTMADQGVWIVTQDALGAQLFTRHQLTTDGTSVNSREFSITRTLDYISVRVKAALEEFIGPWNVGEQPDDPVRIRVEETLNALATEQSNRIGAPLVSWSNLEVTRNATSKDTYDISLDAVIPSPLNNINVTIRI